MSFLELQRRSSDGLDSSSVAPDVEMGSEDKVHLTGRT